MTFDSKTIHTKNWSFRHNYLSSLLNSFHVRLEFRTHIKQVLVTLTLNNNNQNLDEEVFSCVRCWSHAPRLTNMEKLENNFCQSVQIC